MQKFSDVARLPRPEDNVAIATKRLEAGTRIKFNGFEYVLDNTILEGHRFAIRSIPVGGPLLSWGLPFGIASKRIEPGTYVCNEAMLEALAIRQITAQLPAEPNFEDRIVPYHVDAEVFRAAEQVPIHLEMLTFQGYRRVPTRGVGTRNLIVLLGTSSLTSSFVKLLEEILRDSADPYPYIDGIVAVSHTEGGFYPEAEKPESGTKRDPNNLELVLRSLAGFMVHPNVGAVLAVDYGFEPVNNQRLRKYMEANGYPLNDVLHFFMSITDEGDAFREALVKGEALVKSWLEAVNGTQRTAEPLSQLKIALQCGGSDAFSGISGNPLAAIVAKEIIQYGGSANLAETPELIGAETYVLQKVRDYETVNQFLTSIQHFKDWASWHGTSVESNPSGGNKFRGLYNIALKSLGAAMKRHPDVRLDYVIDYARRMEQPGYYFMDSPGLDLESIAGQVAAGCNLIFFVTGNGSVTNFPFVPTIKIVTTTERYRLLYKEMDVNAGRYLDGEPLEKLGQETLKLSVEVASGRPTAGESAGHAQVQLWRNWQQSAPVSIEIMKKPAKPSGQPIPLKPGSFADNRRFYVLRTSRGIATSHVGLILPTSLCSAEVARLAAERLNLSGLGRDRGLSRFVALLHTEGCASSSGITGKLFSRTMLGYACHPMVRHCLFLEHGCEVTHNDYFRHLLKTQGMNLNDYGWASVQLDGGIDRVINKVGSWFLGAITGAERPIYEEIDLEGLRLGVHTLGPIPDDVADTFAGMVMTVVTAGGTVILPDSSRLLASTIFQQKALPHQIGGASLAYGQPAKQPGFHIMEAQSEHWVETISGLGATGVEIILAFTGGHPVQGHPMIPVVVINDPSNMGRSSPGQIDLLLNGESNEWPDLILKNVEEVFLHKHMPKLDMIDNKDFQITRGRLGISL